ncbi:GumC family protein [Marinivivus vitaminiproducens]|uniref:GumC family protein n=1 Tax=Marinivivus vitaminiproducens TaxID=3035935 RepID=UPI00279871E2|nr:polysaccharide biosynthesis tyrosine autokinase [Geminicoccaceae bacterium SCSIO 64248]
MAKEALRYGDTELLSDSGADDEIDLRGLVRALWRRKLILIATVIAITGAAVAYVSQVTPLYSATALMRIETAGNQVVSFDNVTEQLASDPATIESELEYLRSVAFARQAVEELALTEDPEFNPALRPEEASWTDYLDPARYLPETWLQAFQSEMDDAQTRAENQLFQADPREMAIRDTVTTVLTRISAEQVGRSYVMALSFMSEDPAKASRISNAMADVYLVRQLQQKYEASQAAVEWLGQRVEELRQRVIQSEGKVAEYRITNRLSENNRDSPVFMQMIEVNTQLATASAARAESEARLNQVRGILNGGGGVAAAQKVLTSPLMTELRSQEAELVRRMAELSTQYGDRHPQMVSLRGDIGSLRGKMNDEVGRIVQDLENEVAVTRAREAELQSTMSGLEGQVSTQGEASVALNDLLRDAEANRELFQQFLQRYNEIVEQQQLQQADVRVLSAAEAPLFPSYPRKRIFIAIAFVGACVLGLLLVFVIERWDSDYGFRSADEVLNATGARALALVPDIGKKEAGGIPAEEYILQKPNSAFSEALQRVRTSLFLTQDSENPTKSVLITSSVPLEGKSLISASLARQSARSGLRTLLIDADLRRPRLHEVVRVANQNGLAEILNGRILPEEAIRLDEKSGMDFIPAGIGAASPPDLFRSDSMRHLLREMKARYDLIILDSPPVAAVSDSFILSGMLDKTVYVIRWEATPRNVAMHSMRQVVESGADLAGVVLSRVNVKKHARYGYADSGYYSGYYRKYYVN